MRVRTASRKAYDGVSGLTVKQKIQERIEEENPQMSQQKVKILAVCTATGLTIS